MCFAIALGGDNRISATRCQILSQMVRIKSLIAKKGVKGQSFNQGGHANNFTARSGVQGEANEIAQGIRQRQHFRGQAALRASDGLIFKPPFAPLAF